MQKQKTEDILRREERIYIPMTWERPKIAILYEITGSRALYNQGNLPKKYTFFFVRRCRQPCKLGLLGMGSGKPLSLLSAKFLTFLCQSDVEQSRIRKGRKSCEDSPLRDGLALMRNMSWSGFEMESDSESSSGWAIESKPAK
jgi:hypothetical protein